jgi:hypothetical protein
MLNKNKHKVYTLIVVTESIQSANVTKHKVYKNLLWLLMMVTYIAIEPTTATMFKTRQR